MKVLFRITLFLVIATMLALFVACGNNNDTTVPDSSSDGMPSDSSSADTSSTVADSSSEEIKTADVVVDSKTDYVIVYDDTNEIIESQVEAYAKKMKSSFGVTITYQGISKVTEPYEHEIIVGDVAKKRPVVNNVKEKCKTSDFAVSVQDGDVVFYATDDQNYRYLFAALIAEEGLKPADGKLTYTAENDFYYHDSDLKTMNYIEYKNQGKSTYNAALAVSMFTYHEIKKDNGQKMVYRLYVPSNYDPEKEYPLLVVLHGAGERGVDNEKQFDNLIKEMFKHPTTPLNNAIVLAPQCPEGNQWVDTPWANGNYSTASVKESDELKAVMKIVTGLRSDYSVDDNRIYAMGLSMGGFGTWDLLMRHSDVFAAGIPICGGADVSKAPELAKIPIRTFHGGADTVVPFAGTRAMATAIEANDPVDFTYTEFAGAGHDVWTRVGQDLSNLEWLFSQSKAEK